jgi:hypothetical protein
MENNMIMFDLKNEKLAEHLADTLSDLEFEMLVRARVRIQFERALVALPNLYEGQSSCRYHHSFADKSTWMVTVGETYSRSATVEGEVLSLTVTDAISVMRLKYENKLSNLLPSPSDDNS